MAATQSTQTLDFNVVPVMKIYLDSVEAWRKGYEQLTMNWSGSEPAYSVHDTKHTYESAVANWNKPAEEMFKRFVEQQIEICRFFANRWEQYLQLPDQIAHCHSPAELGQVQATFLNRAASDYMHETGKLSQPLGELVSNLTPARHV